MSTTKFKSLVKTIASGKCKQTTLDLKNNDLKDEDLDLLWAAIHSPAAAAFKAKLTEIDLGNEGVVRPNRFSKIIVEDLPSLKEFRMSAAAPHNGGQKLTLRKLPKLETITAPKNNIEEFLSENLPNVTTIDLHWNLLTNFNAALFPLLDSLKIANNRMPIIDLSGLRSLKKCDIIDQPLGAIVAIEPIQISTVYVGNGTTFKRLSFNSFNFDPITKNILHKFEVDFKGHYMDHNQVVNRPDFNLNEFKYYVLQMVNFYRVNRAGFDLKNAATNYMNWLFNPEFKKGTDSTNYRINMSNYDIHLLVIKELFMDNLRCRIKSLYASLNKHWSAEETKELEAFAKQQIAKLEHESLTKLATNPVLKSQMYRYAEKFNLLQDTLKDLPSKPSAALVVVPPTPVKKPRSIIYTAISTQISYIAKKINPNPYKKNKLKE